MGHPTWGTGGPAVPPQQDGHQKPTSKWVTPKGDRKITGSWCPHTGPGYGPRRAAEGLGGSMESDGQLLPVSTGLSRAAHTKRQAQGLDGPEAKWDQHWDERTQVWIPASLLTMTLKRYWTSAGFGLLTSVQWVGNTFNIKCWYSQSNIFTWI